LFGISWFENAQNYQGMTLAIFVGDDHRIHFDDGEADSIDPGGLVGWVNISASIMPVGSQIEMNFISSPLAW